jgi:citrate synthase
MSNRAARIVGQLTGVENTQLVAVPTAGKDTVTVTDNRSGKSFDLDIKKGDCSAINAQKFWDNAKLRLYDPGYTNTVACTSRITYIDGGKGILLYRGIPIEQLALKSTFLEVSYLLLYGALPSKKQLDYFSGRVMKHTYVHEDTKAQMKSFRYDAHPMGMVCSTVAATGTLHPEANPALAGQNIYDDKRVRNKQIHRLVGSMPTIAAFAYRHRIGRPYVDPSENLSYAENFLYMMDKLSGDFKPHPTLARAIDILFTLHADHELNCSTAAMRHLASSGVDVYTCVAGATGALYGPKHGGANEAVLRMLVEIGSVDNIPAFVDGVKKKTRRLMGFGHRVYKNYDPRAKIIRSIAEDVFKVLGKEPLIEVAVALEQHALKDPYFVKRNLYPNVDFFSGLIYKAMGFPTDFFPVLFAIPRTVGWLSHWNEFLDDKENKIVRPRQLYLGAMFDDYQPIEGRKEIDSGDIVSLSSSTSVRRYAVNK